MAPHSACLVKRGPCAFECEVVKSAHGQRPVMIAWSVRYRLIIPERASS